MPSLKDCVSLGHHTKVGGEVEASIIEPYSNKQHHGFLGHSYVGSWVNLGAGTSNSDLKNTYGPVNMEYRSEASKSLHRHAIRRLLHRRLRQNRHQHQHFHRQNHRRLQHGVRLRHHQRAGFCNYAKSFGQITDLPAEVMIAIQQRMFARRQVPQRECDMQLIRDLYENARREVQLSDEPCVFH